jgi:adenylate cyclase class IV
MNYIEREVKVLDVDVKQTSYLLNSLGAEKTFDGNRMFILFDFPDRRISKKGEEVRLTIEGDKNKLSYEFKVKGTLASTKLFVSREKEALDFFSKLGLEEIARIKSHRISWELDGIDFDLDVFPKIKPFLEIDLGNSKVKLSSLLKKLNLKNNEVVSISTREIYQKYGLDYSKLK